LLEPQRHEHRTDDSLHVSARPRTRGRGRNERVGDRCDHSATVGATLDRAIAVGAIGSPRECVIASSRKRVSIQKLSASVRVSLLPSSATIVAVTVPWGAK
jgi:hypothetical protein